MGVCVYIHTYTHTYGYFAQVQAYAAFTYQQQIPKGLKD